MVTARSVDSRTIEGKYRMAGYLGHRSSSLTLGWLATHRNRLRTFALGGKRLSLFIVWDDKGSEGVNHTDMEVAALKVVVEGEKEAMRASV